MESTVYPTHDPTDDPTNRGILKAEAGMKNFSLARYRPAGDMDFFVEHYWVVRWDLRGQAPYRQVILSYPNVNLAFEKDHNGIRAGIYGVPKATSSHFLQGEGTVLGVKFRPGGFYPFLKRPVSGLTGRVRGFRDVFGTDSAALEERIFARQDGEQMARIAEEFLRGRDPERDENVGLIRRIAQAAADDREIARVEDLAARFGINKRALQRLFSRYVGVGPKWVIRRYRLQEAAERMEQDGVRDWGELWQRLGYYDQAHFINDFKAIIGRSPEKYVKEIEWARGNGAVPKERT